MSAIKLNGDELEALQRLTNKGYPFAVIMYVLQLRARMDFTFFTVGDTKGSVVAERFLMDCIEREAKAGSHHSAKKRDRNFVQRQLSAMVEEGLVVRLPKKKKSDPMRLFFPLAAGREFFRPREERTMSEQAGARKTGSCGYVSQCPVALGDGVLSFVGRVGDVEHQNTSRSALILVNRNIDNIGIYLTRARDNEGGGVIPHDWQPSGATVDKLVARFMLPRRFVIQRALEFRVYWSEAGAIRADWNAKFYEWVLRGVNENNPNFRQALEMYYKKSA